MKQCSKCGEHKELPEFYKRGDTDKYRSECKACTNKRVHDRYHSCDDTKAAHAKAARKSALKKHYGISPEDYDSMLASQGGACKICGSTNPDWDDKKRFFCVDHNHTTGAVRGLLCHPCNVGLGNFKDDPDLLSKAKEYLLEDRV